MVEEVDAVALALYAFRIAGPLFCVVAVLFTFGSRLFTRAVLSLVNEGYEGIPTGSASNAPGVDSSLGTRLHEALQTETVAESSDGIVPVVVTTLKPRIGLVYSLMTLLMTSYVADGALIIVRGLTSPVWEPRDAAAWTGMDWQSGGFFIAYMIVSIVMRLEETSSGEGGRWGKYYPKVVVGATWVSEAVIDALVVTMLTRQSRLSKFDIGHIVNCACRLFIVTVLALSHTVLLYRKSYTPVTRLSSPAGRSYGTFLGANTEGGSIGGEASGTQTPAQKANTGTLSTQYVRRDANQVQGTLTVFKRIKILFPYLWPKDSIKLQFVALACFCLVAVGRFVNFFVPILLGKVTDQLTNHKSPWFPLSLYVTLRFLQGSGGIIQVIQSTAWIPVAQYTDRRMSMMTFSHLLDLSLSYHTRRKTGEVLRILDRGSAINNFFQMFLFSFAPIFFDIGGAVIYLSIHFDVWLASSLLVIMLIYVYVSVHLTQMRTVVRRQANDKDKYVRGIQGDSLLNWETIKYQCGEEFEVSRYLEATRDYQRSEFAVYSSLYMLNFVQNIIVAFALFGGCFATAYQVNIGKKTVGDFVVFVAYLGQLIGPLNQLGTLYRMVQQNLIDTDNLMKLLAEPKEIEDRPNSSQVSSAKGKIEFDNVSFSYDGKVTTLDRISFTIEAGSTVAIVGETGSGKSTILRLLFRFYDPTEGSIKLDGVDIRDLTQTSYRQQIGCVPQDMVLFNETIRFNIAYGNIRGNDGAGPTMSEVEEAAKTARVHHRIAGFPEGYETRVGERGVRLSGGERQRVAIARVLIRNPPILLLDEATASLDTVTEREIQASLKALSEHRTTISVAHRLSTIVDSDVILVVQEGRISERGNHSELLAQDGIYANLWRKQSRAAEEDNSGTSTGTKTTPTIPSVESNDVTLHHPH